jgi:hypothetical protein
LRPQERKTDLVFTADHSSTDGLGCGNFLKMWLFATLNKKAIPSLSMEMLEKLVPKTKKSKITTFFARKRTVLKQHSDFGTSTVEATTEITRVTEATEGFKMKIIVLIQLEKVAIPPAADHFYPPVPRHVMALWGVLCWMTHLRFTLLPLRTLPLLPDRKTRHLEYLQNEPVSKPTKTKFN